MGVSGFIDTKIKACNAMNAMFVETVDTIVKTHPHILPITFLMFWKAETEGFSTTPSNTIYVDTLNTRHKYF